MATLAVALYFRIRVKTSVTQDLCLQLMSKVICFNIHDIYVYIHTLGVIKIQENFVCVCVCVVAMQYTI